MVQLDSVGSHVARSPRKTPALGEQKSLLEQGNGVRPDESVIELPYGIRFEDIPLVGIQVLGPFPFQNQTTLPSSKLIGSD